MRLARSKNKILWVLLSTTLAPFVFIAIFLFFKKKSVSKELLLNYAQLKREKFEQSLKSSGLQLEGAANVFANTQIIRTYYEQVNSDTIKNKEKLKQDFARMMGNEYHSADKASSSGYELQLFTPPAKSIFKTWSQSSGEDASLLRKSILHVNAFQQSVWGLELGKSGLKIRGLAPVRSLDMQIFIGTMEIYASLNNILQEMSNPNERWALYMLDRNFRLISSIERGRSSDFHRIGRYVFVQGDALEFNSNLLQEENLDAVWNSAVDDIHTTFQGGKWNFAFPVTDFSEKKIAIAVFQSDRTIVEEAVPALIEEALLFIIIFIFIVIFILSRYLSRPVEIAETTLSVPRFLFFFPEVSLLRKQLLRFISEFAQISDSINNFFLRKGAIDVSKSHQLYDILIGFQEDYKAEQERYEQLSIELKEKNWLAQAAKKVDAVLHKEYDSLENLMGSILREFMQQLEVQAGAIYHVNNETKEILPITSFVAKRKVHVSEIVRFGDGLVGSLAIEKKRKLIQEIPEDYFSIVSGLGQSAPKQILLEPLLSRDNIVAIMEFGTIGEISTVGLELLNSTTDQVAIRLGMFDITAKAKELFQSAQSKEAQLKENVARLKNLENELAGLRKEHNQLTETERISNRLLKDATLYMRYDPKGKVIEVGELWRSISNIPLSQIVGTSFYDGIDFDKFEYQKQQMFWNALVDGELHKRTMTYNFFGNELTVNEVFLGETENGKLKSVIKVAFAVQ